MKKNIRITSRNLHYLYFRSENKSKQIQKSQLSGSHTRKFTCWEYHKTVEFMLSADLKQFSWVHVYHAIWLHICLKAVSKESM